MPVSHSVSSFLANLIRSPGLLQSMPLLFLGSHSPSSSVRFPCVICEAPHLSVFDVLFLQMPRFQARDTRSPNDAALHGLYRIFLHHCYRNVVCDNKLARFHFEFFAVRSLHGLASFKLIISLTLLFVHFYYTTFTYYLFTIHSQLNFICWFFGK